MDARIFKYKITVGEDFEVDLAGAAEIIHVEAQNGQPVFWAIVPTAYQSGNIRRFRVIPTGFISFETDGLRYCGTFLVAGDAFVGHLFEVKGSNETIHSIN